LYRDLTQRDRLQESRLQRVRERTIADEQNPLQQIQRTRVKVSELGQECHVAAISNQSAGTIVQMIYQALGRFTGVNRT
jgi:hypothetical protein